MQTMITRLHADECVGIIENAQRTTVKAFPGVLQYRWAFALPIRRDLRWIIIELNARLMGK